MNCHRCGNTLPTNARGCPSCDGAPSKTKKLSDTDLHKTRALVPLERCENCGWLVYPNDNECSACGTWISRPWKQSDAAPKSRRRAKQKEKMLVPNNDESHAFRRGNSGYNSRQIWTGIVIGAVVLGIFATVWHFMFASNLQ